MAGRKKIVFLGIDAADKDLILGWAEAGILPTFRSMLDCGLSGVTSNPPGLFVGAVWPSFWTGMQPGNHGWYCYRQLRPGTYDIYRIPAGNFIKKEPFWNSVSRAGRKVAIIDLPHAYPAEINGIQLVEWGTHDPVYGFMSWPASLARDVEYQFGRHPAPPKCNGRRSPADFIAFRDQLVAGVKKKAELTGYLLKQQDWDLFAAVFSEAHCVGHQCWHFHDRGYPLHDEQTAEVVGDPVKDVYRAIDSAIGRLVAQAGKDTTIIIFCSHGMGPHYDGTFLLDSILRALENPNVAKRVGGFDAFKRKCGNWKNRIKAITDRAEMQRPPSGEKPVRVSHDYDFANRKCFPVPNNTVSGGIRVNLVGREPQGKIRPGTEYEAFCTALAKDLLQLINEDTGEPVVREVFRTADRYAGDHLDYLPDLIVEWNRSKPISSICSPKFGRIRKEYRGGRTGDHKPDGMFIVRGPSVQPGRLERNVSVTDLAPTIASMVDVRLPGVDGRPIAELLSR